MINAQAYNTNVEAINKRLRGRTDNMAGPRKYEMVAGRPFQICSNLLEDH